MLTNEQQNDMSKCGKCKGCSLEEECFWNKAAVMQKIAKTAITYGEENKQLREVLGKARDILAKKREISDGCRYTGNQKFSFKDCYNTDKEAGEVIKAIDEVTKDD